MKTQPRQYNSNKYNTCTIVTSPVYIGSKVIVMLRKVVGTLVYLPGIDVFSEAISTLF